MPLLPYNQIISNLNALSKEEQRGYHQAVYGFKQTLGRMTDSYDDTLTISEDATNKLKKLNNALGMLGGWNEMPKESDYPTTLSILNGAGDVTELLNGDAGNGKSVYEYIIEREKEYLRLSREETQKRVDNQLTKISGPLGLDINIHALHIGKKAYEEEQRKAAEEKARIEEEARRKREEEARIRREKEERARQKQEARDAEAKAQQELAEKTGSLFTNRDLLNGWDAQISGAGGEKPIGQATSILHNAFSDYEAALREQLAAVQAELDNPQPEQIPPPADADLPPVEDPEERKARLQQEKQELQRKQAEALKWRDAFGCLKEGPKDREKLGSQNEEEREQGLDSELKFLKGTAPLAGFAAWLNSEAGKAIFHEAANTAKKKGKSLDELGDAAQMFDRMAQFGMQDAAAIQKIKSPYLGIAAELNKIYNGKGESKDKNFLKDLLVSLRDAQQELQDGDQAEKELSDGLLLLIEDAEQLDTACKEYDPKRPGKNIKEITEKADKFDKKFFDIMSSPKGQSLFGDEARQWRAMKYRAKSTNYTEKTWKNYLDFHSDMFWEKGKEPEYIAKALVAYYHVNSKDPKINGGFSKKKARKEADQLLKEPAFQYLMKNKGKEIQEMMKAGKYDEVSKLVSQPFVTNDREALKRAYADLEKQHEFFLQYLNDGDAPKEFREYCKFIKDMTKEYHDSKGMLTNEQMGIRLGQAFQKTEKFLKGRKSEKAIGSDEELMTRYALDSMDILSKVSGAGKAKVQAIFDRTNVVRTSYGRHQTQAKFGQFKLAERLQERKDMTVKSMNEFKSELDRKNALSPDAIKAGDRYKVEDLPEVNDNLDIIPGVTEMDPNDPKKPLKRELVYVDEIKADIKRTLDFDGQISMDSSHRMVRGMFGLAVTPVFKQKQPNGEYRAVCFKDSMDYRISRNMIVSQADHYRNEDHRKELAKENNPFRKVKEDTFKSNAAMVDGEKAYADFKLKQDIDSADYIDRQYGLQPGQAMPQKQAEAGQGQVV